MTPEVRATLLHFLDIKYRLFLSGGFSPFCRLFNRYRQEQRFILGLFGLRETMENLRLFNQTLFDFLIEEARQTASSEEVIFDGTAKSVYKENGRQFLASAQQVHLRSLEGQAERLFIRLKERANATYGCEESEE